MADINIERTQSLMKERGLAAILAISPENFHYTTGFSSMLTYLRQAPITSIAVLPASPDVAPAAIIPDAEAKALGRSSYIKDIRAHQTWMDGADLSALLISKGRPITEEELLQALSGAPKPHPSKFDTKAIISHLVAVLSERGLTQSIVGIEFDQLPLEIYLRIKEALPNLELRDTGDLFRELRLIKTEREIAKIRKAVELAHVGLRAAISSINSKTVCGEIFNTYQKAILDQVAKEELDDAQVLTKGIVRVGWEPWVGTAWSRPLKPGDHIQFDVGLRFQGYRSDVGRTYAFAQVLPASRRIHAALLAAHNAAIEQMRPGKRFSDAFNAGHAAARKSGLPTYSRGHIGHTLGLDAGEELPCISATDDHLFTPGNVLAVETPYYVDGIGGFQIEEEVLITSAGAEFLSDLSRDMIALGL